MVWICMVKVISPYFALAHVSHFFRTGAVGLQAIDAFFTFWTFWNFTVASSASVFASPCPTFFRTSAVGPQAIVAFYSFCNFWKFIFVSCAPAFGPRVAHCPAFRRILSIFFTFRFVPSVRSGGFCSQHPSGHADRSRSSSEKHALRPPRFRRLEKYFVWGPPSHIFPNDLRCGFRKLKEQGVGNRASGAVLVPKSLLLLLWLLRTPTPAGTRFYLHKEF